jgi:hypothetical protein
MVFLFIGHLKPPRGRVKSVSLASGLVVAFVYTLVASSVEVLYSGGVLLPLWGIGSSILVAGAISIVPRMAESRSTGVLDTRSLRYPPEVTAAPPEPLKEE